MCAAQTIEIKTLSGKKNNATPVASRYLLLPIVGTEISSKPFSLF